MQDTNKGQVYVGKIISLTPIPDADFIVSATVVCGEGGKWRGVVRREEYDINSKCLVYLPDSLVPEGDEMRFLEKDKWRVKMKRFKGAPSEVVIMPINWETSMPIGTDVTDVMGVTKYCKPVPPHLAGMALGDFPGFVPKTDELNYQRHGDLVDQLDGKPYYITEKADGSSTTAYRWKGEFGLCSRNLELARNKENGYWKVAEKYKVEERLPEGIALQWETCGPGIQSNHMGLSSIDGFAFSAYDIKNHRYLEMQELFNLCKRIGFPICQVLEHGQQFDKSRVETLGEGKYPGGHQREGVVVRSQTNFGHAPISFKVINLNYEK